MQIVNATPPAGLPALLIVLDREKGYEPTHWMVAAEGRPTMF
ncbi:hypothetical protein [Burkholderia ubonensis]|nr:hypothetical protein [Burkholderia ubonensis]